MHGGDSDSNHHHHNSGDSPDGESPEVGDTSGPSEVWIILATIVACAVMWGIAMLINH
ncbi:hypothetical protein [Streptacidiphilus sp. P02-A3a]|uniref:hypothetical protein n=1 Tax=Streptacidiphilus sp. P02-A3a TaxID=2704468 RepID=UPI0015FC4260|nr:hypothetical protein [Streptacidiphilus sp. P02-A3a]QMU69616.1 hypothetical protein GXP74_16590 [Streptacidiphilus sp. P02-A3a]